MLQNSNTHSDTQTCRVWVKLEEQRRHRDASVCVILSLWMSSRHTHAFQHVLTHAFMHPQTGNKLVNLHRSFFLRFQIRLEYSHLDKKIREASRDQKPLGFAGAALHPPAASQPVQVLWFTETCGMLVLRWIVPLSSDRAGIVWPSGFICTEIPLLRSSALCATSLWLHTQTHRR